MAKANWLNVNPSSGSGTKDIQISSNLEHTGRLSRTSILTFKATNCPDVTRNVILAGKPEYVNIPLDTMSSPKEGKVITINGESNSRLLTFSLGVGDLEISLPTTYLANSISVNNGESIPGDPGANTSYPFSITVTVPANELATEISRQVIVTDDAGNTDTCTLTLSAGDLYLTVLSGDINLDYLGTPITVKITSNANWTIE